MLNNQTVGRRRLRRAERRQHYRRLQKSRAGFYGRPTTKPIIHWDGFVEELMTEAEAGLVANTPCIGSCGNPRRWPIPAKKKLTIQELRFLQEPIDGLEFNANQEVETMAEAFCWHETQEDMGWGETDGPSVATED